jgi:peptide/nickel transport system permease protein
LELLEQVGIDDPSRIFALYPHEISGGMAQRVHIAGAISPNPDLLIADEPTTALDVMVQADILDLLRELREHHGLSILLVTHNFGVVADLCDSVSVMQEGHIVEVGTVGSLFTNPRHCYTRALLDSVLQNDGPVRTSLVARTEPRGRTQA